MGTLKSVNPNRLPYKKMMFVSHYSTCMDWVEAARLCGYVHPAKAAERMQKDPLVRQAIESLQADAVLELQVDAKRLRKEVAYCAMRDVADLCTGDGYIDVGNLRNLPERVRRTIDGLKIKQFYDRDGNVVGQQCELKLVPKLGAIELLAKMIGAIEPEQQRAEVASLWDQLYLEHHTIESNGKPKKDKT